MTLRRDGGSPLVRRWTQVSRHGKHFLVAASFASLGLLAGCGSNHSVAKVPALVTPPNFDTAPGAGDQPLENGLPVARVNTSDVVTAPSSAATLPTDALFDTGSAALRPSAAAALQKVATQIQDLDPSAAMHFVGHADSRGDSASNQVLSQQRAGAVMQWFKDNGFKGNTMSANGVGATEPLLPDTDASGAFIEAAGQKNRRVDIILLS